MELPPQDTRNLLRLLALKRHESPPPGFFNRLPNRVLVNIRAGSEINEAPWWNRLWDSLIREPMVASSYSALAMGGLLFGVSVYQTAVESDPRPVDFASRENAYHEPRFTPPSFVTPQPYSPSSASAASLPPFNLRRGGDAATMAALDHDPLARPGTIRVLPVRMDGPTYRPTDGPPPRQGSLISQLER